MDSSTSTSQPRQLLLPVQKTKFHIVCFEPFALPAHQHPSTKLSTVYCVKILDVVAMACEMADYATSIATDKNQPPLSSD
jgi:hypothetical protein